MADCSVLVKANRNPGLVQCRNLWKNKVNCTGEVDPDIDFLISDTTVSLEGLVDRTHHCLFPRTSDCNSDPMHDLNNINHRAMDKWM